ncbi:hypothetical protein [Streptomyces catenulae]|uniref:Uncharacterized protein n=1 Tax=Streptomyces catenulae TaxID=66875 RepID=A0ABV2YZP7_9ACTN|nr:hypothetical protein [Streptomyces catenulae]
MTSPLLLVTEVPVAQETAQEALAVWQDHHRAAGDRGSVLYRSTETPTVLELTPLTGLADLAARADRWGELRTALAPLATGDVRRQVLEFVGAPKPTAGELPETPYIQLRHVEVKPPVHEEYLSWREGTIFAEVRKSERIEAFLAYHSLLSTEPGVMFVAGFSCPPQEYLPTFASARYAEIARQAHPRFVTDEGLYTRIYRRVSDTEARR